MQILAKPVNFISKIYMKATIWGGEDNFGPGDFWFAHWMPFGQRHVAINIYNLCKGNLGLGMESNFRRYSMHTSLFLYAGNLILLCKLCHYIMQITI